MGSKNLGGKNQIGLPARRQSVKFIKKILRDKKSLDELFSGESALQSLTTKDRSLVRHICATVLRRKGQITQTLNTFLGKPLPRKSGDAWEILLVGAAQILYMDIPAHAAIDLSVKLASYDRNARHFKGLINAVLRRLAESTKNSNEDILINTPQWLIQNWQRQYTDEEIQKIIQQHLQIPPLDITCKSQPEYWAKKLDAELLPNGSLRLGLNGKSPGRIENLPGYKEGAWWVQDVAATFPVKLMGEIEGKIVLDLCAAPGGKTMQLANSRAQIISVDLSDERLERLRENLIRTDLKAEIICADATNYTPRTTPDIILLDAPCSATGTIRRHPDLPILKDETSLTKYIKAQASLLEHAATILKPGGLLIYCTCSLECDEGENQIETLLEKFPQFETDRIKADEIPGLEKAITKEGFLRTLPFYYGDKGGMDGFFVARLKKSTS